MGNEQKTGIGYRSRERNWDGMKKKLELSTTIEDSLGLRTGISINRVRVIYDKESDWIKITGRLATNDRTYTSFEYEPDLQADILNTNSQVCLSSTSTHEGRLAASQKVSFSMEMRHISAYVSWDEILEIHMYLIFRGREPCRERSGPYEKNKKKDPG